MKNKMILFISLISLFNLSSCSDSISTSSSIINKESSSININESTSNYVSSTSSTVSSSLSNSKESISSYSSTSSASTPSSSVSNSLSNSTSSSTISSLTSSNDDVENIPGVFPCLSNDNKKVQYGFYPQSYVKDEELIKSLNELNESDNNWYYYEDSYYVKEISKVYKGDSYSFNDNTSIVNGDEYWFKCEPITWDVLCNENGNYTLVSSLLLDVGVYYNNYENRTINEKNIYANDYEYSDIREWINNEFFNSAFRLNNKNIVNTSINNNEDKVYLLSYQDYINEDYGFSLDSNVSKTREVQVTDYAKVKGAWCNKDKNTSSYWTRTPSSEYSYAAWNVNSGGKLSEYAVDGIDHCVRPAITIFINK